MWRMPTTFEEWDNWVYIFDQLVKEGQIVFTTRYEETDLTAVVDSAYWRGSILELRSENPDIAWALYRKFGPKHE